LNRTDISGRQTSPQRIDISRPCSLVVQQFHEHEGQSKKPGTAMAFDHIEQSLGIKMLTQDERSAEPDTGKHGEKAASVYHRASQSCDLVAIEIPVLKRFRRLR
jgi:hypothetical protein